MIGECSNIVCRSQAAGPCDCLSCGFDRSPIRRRVDDALVWVDGTVIWHVQGWLYRLRRKVNPTLGRGVTYDPPLEVGPISFCLPVYMARVDDCEEGDADVGG